MKFLSFRILFVMVTIVLFVSCKKNDKDSTPYECKTCNKTPEAAAANNTSTKGIYKGIIIGSSGTIKFDIANNGNTITAVMIIDGVSVNLTSNVAWTNGQAYIAPFTGTLNGQPVTINFSVGLSGTTPTVTSSNIPGHPNAVMVMVKETSDSLIECFEGTFSGASQGTLNIILSRTLNKWGGVARKTGSRDKQDFDGVITGTTITASGVSATLTNDEITSGKWDDGQGGKGTWSAKRTL